jgi:hypothetical protein
MWATEDGSIREITPNDGQQLLCTPSACAANWLRQIGCLRSYLCCPLGSGGVTLAIMPLLSLGAANQAKSYIGM